ncbi:hypothetical protein [Solidesulfovibrio sp.]
MVPVASAVYAFCHSTDPKKWKFGVCVIPDERLFFLFNTKPPPRILAVGMMEVSKDQAPFLDYTSYLDTISLMPYEVEPLRDALAKNRVWGLHPDLREAIKYKVRIHGRLGGGREKFVLNNF